MSDSLLVHRRSGWGNQLSINNYGCTTSAPFEVGGTNCKGKGKEKLWSCIDNQSYQRSNKISIKSNEIWESKIKDKI